MHDWRSPTEAESDELFCWGVALAVVAVAAFGIWLIA